jgi:PAS domain S-box-containing protein
MKLQTLRQARPVHPKWVQILLDLPFVGVAICDSRNRRWTHLNDRLCAILGYNRTELLRLNWREICHPGDHARGEAAFARALARRIAHVRAVIRLLHKDGRPIAVEVDLSYARSRSGTAGNHLIALVTEAGRSATAAPEQPAQRIVSEGRTPMVVLDAETWSIVDANPAAQQFYGWTLQEMQRLGLHVWDVSQTERTAVLQRLRAAAAGTIGHFEGTHRTASGEIREVEIYCGPVHAGGRACVYGIVHDRTESRRTEAARRDAEEKLHAVVEQSITGIYIIEDGRFSFVNPRMAQIFGYADDEMTGVEVLETVAPADHGLVTENIRRRLAGEITSLQFEYRGRRKDGALIELGARGRVAVIRGKRMIIGVLQDISERRRSERRAEEYVRKLEAAMVGAVRALSGMVALRDPYTAGHERRVANIASNIASELDLTEEQVRAVQIAGEVHDIGKISVPSEILSKPTRLSVAEFDLVKMHAPNGFDILKVVEFPWAVAEMARQHHERMDGSGYPQGLKGDQILPEARILAVADVIEAMASHRPYRPALGIAPALAEIESGAGSLYDSDVSACALRLFRDKGYAIPA